MTMVLEKTSAPLPNTEQAGERPLPVEPLDPALAKTPGQFFRAVRSNYPCARRDKQDRILICGRCECRSYVEILKAYPVNENIGRDEKTHEVEAAFDDVALSVAIRQLNQQVFEVWHTAYWTEISED